MPNEEQVQIIVEYLQTDLENLLVATGRILVAYREDADVFMASSEERKSAIIRANEFLSEKRDELRQKLCIELDILEKLESNKFSNNIELISIIADSLVGTAVMLPPFTLSVILFKKGLHHLCNEQN